MHFILQFAEWRGAYVTCFRMSMANRMSDCYESFSNAVDMKSLLAYTLILVSSGSPKSCSGFVFPHCFPKEINKSGPSWSASAASLARLQRPSHRSQVSAIVLGHPRQIGCTVLLHLTRLLM